MYGIIFIILADRTALVASNRDWPQVACKLGFPMHIAVRNIAK